MSDKRYEDIEKIIEKANVTFAESKEAYEKNVEDLLETLIYLEKKSKLKKKSKECKYKNYNQDGKDGFRKAEGFFKRMGTKLLKRNFIAYNDNKTFINMPLVIVLLIFLFALPQSMFLLFLVILTGCRLKVVNYDHQPNQFYHNFEENIKNGVSDIRKAFEETIKPSDDSKKDKQEEKKNDDFEINESKEDDFEEIIID